MYKHNTEVDILVNDKPVKQYPHNGRIFIEAKHWTEYSIRIRNNESQRQLFVVTVDGLNVLDGEVGGKTKAGYVINGYNSLEIKGFRTSNDIVHPFKFNRKDRSYAAGSDVTGGDTSNCGVIGVEVYNEKIKPAPQIIVKEVIREVEKPYDFWSSCYPWPYKPVTTWTTSSEPTYSYSRGQTDNSSSRLLRSMNMCDTSNVVSNLCSVSDTDHLENSRGFDMGTEFSEREVVDKVQSVEFEIGYRVGTFLLYYASKDSLIDMGVPMTKQTQITFPEPFPTNFCRPPRR